MGKCDKRIAIMSAFDEYANDVTISDDDFANTLKDFIDDIESEVSSLRHTIDDAYQIINKLYDEFY